MVKKLHQIYNQQYSLIITDLQMPILNGFDTTIQIRKFTDDLELP